MLKNKVYSIHKYSSPQNGLLTIPVLPEFRIYFLLSGQLEFKINEANAGETVFICRKEEIALITSNCGGTARDCSKNTPLECYELRLRPDYVMSLSADSCDLSACFREGGDRKQILASIEISMMIKNLMNKLYKLNKEEEFGTELFEQATLTLLLIFAGRGCLETLHRQKAERPRRWLLDDIFSYIEGNLEHEILLDEIAAHFYVSKYHLSKEFKKQTGTTLHSYIVKRKLSYCKELIEQGLPIIEVYQRGGFGEYTHFFRAFKKEFGMTPKQYYRQNGSRD